MNKEKKVEIMFERITTAGKPKSLKVSDMSKVRGGHVPRGDKAGSGGADGCACGCARG